MTADQQDLGKVWIFVFNDYISAQINLKIMKMTTKMQIHYRKSIQLTEDFKVSGIKLMIDTSICEVHMWKRAFTGNVRYVINSEQLTCCINNCTQLMFFSAAITLAFVKNFSLTFEWDTICGRNVTYLNLCGTVMRFFNVEQYVFIKCNYTKI